MNSQAILDLVHAMVRFGTSSAIQHSAVPVLSIAVVLGVKLFIVLGVKLFIVPYTVFPRHLHSACHMGIEAIVTLDLARGLRHQVGTPPLVVVPFPMGDTVACLLVAHPL
eukprot:COSAG05_NODE_1130_length_5776_cov_3.102695_4_plen_110_part_00